MSKLHFIFEARVSSVEVSTDQQKLSLQGVNQHDPDVQLQLYQLDCTRRTRFQKPTDAITRIKR